MWPQAGPSERRFREKFARDRVHSTKNYVLLHLLVTLAYIGSVKGTGAQLAGLAGAILPLAYWLPRLSVAERIKYRTPLVLAVRLTLVLASAHEFTTDWAAGRHAFPLLFFKVLLTGRVIGLFCCGLGLQLPLAMEAPLELLGVVAVAATAAPRQCGLGRAAPGPLFLLNANSFAALADWLDWPLRLALSFCRSPMGAELDGRGLCTAVYLWVQVVLAMGVPLVVLWATERRERLAGRHRRQGVLRRKLGDCSPCALLLFFAQAAWLLIRTACQLALP